MNFNLLALIAFATAVIAAPASEDIQADTPSHAFEPFVDPHAHVNTQARGETEYHEGSYKSSYYQGQSKSSSYKGQRGGKCTTALCCQPLREVNGDNNGAIVSLNDFVTLDPVTDLNTANGVFGFDCKPIIGYIGTCPSQPVCCSEKYSGDAFTIACVPVTVDVE